MNCGYARLKVRRSKPLPCSTTIRILGAAAFVSCQSGKYRLCFFPIRGVVREGARELGITANHLSYVQITRYETGGRYDWHHDDDHNDEGATRKVSLSVCLNNPDQWEGGEFLFKEVNGFEDPRERGTLILFPSYFVHQVAPVTRGVRYSLVAWMEGPPWR